MFQVHERKKRWTKFLDTSSNTNTMLFLHYSDDKAPDMPFPYPRFLQKRIDWAVDNYFYIEAQAQWLDSDRIPAAHAFTGTEIFAEAFGCKVHESEENMPVAIPMVHTRADLYKVKVPKLHESSLDNLLEMCMKIKQRVGSEAVFQLPDIQSPLDIAALIWEKTDFMMALVDAPEAVKELVCMTEELLTAFLDEWFHTFGPDFVAHYPQYYMEKGFTFSEDEVGCFSAEMFREFSLDSINRLSARYGGCGMHCCANSRHQWENFKLIRDLRLINIIQPPEVLNELGAVFGNTICHMHPCDQEIPEWAMRCPPATHIVIETWADSRHQAIEISKKFRDYAASRE